MPKTLEELPLKPLRNAYKNAVVKIIKAMSSETIDDRTTSPSSVQAVDVEGFSLYEPQVHINVPAKSAESINSTQKHWRELLKGTGATVKTDDTNMDRIDIYFTPISRKTSLRSQANIHATNVEKLNSVAEALQGTHSR